jgi:hypothetical protein
MEMSPTPQRALRAADALHDLVPDAGHLVHMATHIDVLCGRYSNVAESNGRAIAADAKYLARQGADNFYSLYRCHNYHFKLYGAMFLGQLQPALSAQARPPKMPSIHPHRTGLAGSRLHHQRNPRCGSKLPLDALWRLFLGHSAFAQARQPCGARAPALSD